MNSWHYQLQKHIRLDIKADVLVMDIDADPAPYLNGTRQVWAYLSVGEAEDYRRYWPNLPKGLIGPVNPDWPGNYPVKFWDERWQDIIQLKILAAQVKGFTGLYLDKCDVVWDGAFPDVPEDELIEAMVDFIDTIAGVCQEMKVCMQNAEPLLQDQRLHEVLDAIAIEDLLFGDPFDGVANDAMETAERMEWIDLWKGPKFAIEYLDNPRLIKLAKEELRRRGFIVTIGSQDRELAGN